MELSRAPDRRVKPLRTDPSRFGRGRGVFDRGAQAIAEAIAHRHGEARLPESGVTSPDLLTQIIWEECGRAIRGPSNLALIEAYCCQM